MANCPKCGSESIQVKQETNVSWGRAAVGYALFGIVGGAVGAVTGEDRYANFCLDCGTTWKPAILYDVLQFVEKETGKNLDLKNQQERQFLNELIPLIDNLSLQIEDIGRQERISVQSKRDGSKGGSFGCLAGILVAILIGILSRSFAGFFTFLIWGGAIFSFIGATMEKFSEGESAIEDIKKSHKQQKMYVEKRFKNDFKMLREKYLI